MKEDSDTAQSRVFAAMLTAEISAVSARVDTAERVADAASRNGDTRGRAWHAEEARSQRKVLYELHRQLEALDARFSVVGCTTSRS